LLSQARSDQDYKGVPAILIKSEQIAIFQKWNEMVKDAAATVC